MDNVTADDEPRDLVSRKVPVMQRNDWYKDAEEKVRNALNGRNVDAFVCLGIGSPFGRIESTYQMACAMALAKGLQIEDTRVMVYDPMMIEEDQKLVRKTGWRLGRSEDSFSLNGEGALLLYMPHCNIGFYEHVLRRIKGGNALHRVVLFGNELERAITKTSSKLQPWFINAVGKSSTKIRHCVSARISPWETAFNDLAITTFAKEELIDLN